MTDTFLVRARCSNCGHVVEKLPLNIREWECPECGSHHDRDVNAAINILRMGTRVGVRRKGTPTKKTAGGAVSAPVAHGGDPLWRRWLVCGATVRPSESKSRLYGCYVSAAPPKEAAESPYQ